MISYIKNQKKRLFHSDISTDHLWCLKGKWYILDCIYSCRRRKKPHCFLTDFCKWLADTEVHLSITMWTNGAMTMLKQIKVNADYHSLHKWHRDNGDSRAQKSQRSSKSIHQIRDIFPLEKLDWRLLFRKNF